MTISRRRFVQGAGVAGLGLLAGCGRLPGPAALPARVPRVGVLSSTASASSATVEALRQGLRDLGYVEGQNLALEIRNGQGREDTVSELALELTRLPVDVIVAGGATSVRASLQVTASIPIVMAAASDPVANGFIASLARPEGNVTGVNPLSEKLTAKRLELLKEVLPTLSRVAVLGMNASQPDAEEARIAAGTLGLQLHLLELGTPDDLPDALDAATEYRAEALLLLPVPVTAAHAPRIASLALATALPAVFDRREFAVAGGLMAYGPSVTGQWRRAAYYVDRILKGAKPADLPVEQAMTFDFVINLKTAQALGLTIPQHVLLQATEVIQ